MQTHLLLMMGGSGIRLGADIPKQYIEIDGKPIFAYILEKYNRLTDIDDIVIVSHSDWIDFVQEWVNRLNVSAVSKVVQGGETRSHSVLNGLKALSEFAGAEDVVLIHDATHPYVDEEGTKGVIKAIEEVGGATLGEYQYDTVYGIDEDDYITETLPRQRIIAGASPEGFKFGDIYGIYSNASDEELANMTSAGAIAKSHNIPMKVIPCNVVNLKITHKNDLDALMGMMDYFFPKKTP